VYNNKDVLDNYLLRSIEVQTARHELILIDNRGHQYPSAAKALNQGSRKTNSEFIMFIHQDIYLPNPYWLKEAEDYLKAIPDLGVAGVAGMIAGGHSNKERGRNIIKHGKSLETWAWGNPIVKPETVQTVDECLFIIPKKIFDEHPLDEETCAYWDFYAVDYCLSIRESIGLNTYVLPLMVHHGSVGHITEKYFITLNRVIKKHRQHYKQINTTTGSYRTSPFFGYLQRKIKWIDMKALKVIPKQLRKRRAS
jgi:GT2 family glycosyltransferase